MAKYRARTCPHCKYYVGFSVSKLPTSSKETGITSFCLNCGYRLPIHTILHGIKRATSHFRRARLKLANVQPDHLNNTADGAADAREQALPAEYYSRHLRIIGQQLQQRRIDTFNLQCTESGYSVWARSETMPGRSLLNLGSGYLEKWWSIKDQGQHGYTAAGTPGRRLEYSLEDLAHLEELSRKSRDQATSFADGHSLSQLLRTIGSLLYQRNHRLLGISWRDLSICIVFETAQGKREIDVFRPDNLYDIWVRMYLRRENRVLSDVPR